MVNSFTADDWDSNTPEEWDSDQYHNASQIISGAFWEIKQQLGAGTAHDLIFTALDNLDQWNPTFMDVRDALIAADYVLNSGSNISDIEDIFDGREIGDSFTSVSGNINSNTTWSDNILVTGTTNVYATLTVEPGTRVYLEDGVAINIRNGGGKLIAEGTEEEPIYFKRADVANDWQHLNLMSSLGNSIEWCVIEGAYLNLQIASKNNTISNTTIRDATYRNLQGWHNQDTGGGNAEATITNVLIDNSATVGFVAHYIDADVSYTTIRNSGQAGLYISSGEIYPFHHNRIHDNGASTRDGIEVTSSGTIYLHNSSLGKGYNEIYNNGDDQISGNGDLYLGQTSSSGGYNRISGTYGSGKYYVDNNSGVTVQAENNYWGASVPAGGMFDGSMDFFPYQSSNPAGGSGSGGEVPLKVNTETDQFISNDELNSVFSRLEKTLIEASEPLQIRNAVSQLYKISGADETGILKEKFEMLVKSGAQDKLEPYPTNNLNHTFSNYSKILLAKSMIRSDRYDEAGVYLDQLNPERLSGFDMRDYLHLKMDVEIYHGKYEAAWKTLEELYTFQEAEGEDMTEVRALYSVIEEDLKARFTHSNELDSITENETTKVSKITLQAYPNPFNPSTNINFTIPVKSDITLKVFDMLGREIAELANGIKEAGSYTVNFDASNLSSGVYIYQLHIGNEVHTKKMTLIK